MRCTLWAALTLSLASDPWSVAVAGVWERSYPIAARADLRVSTNDGDVRVVAWERDEIRVRISATGWDVGPGGVRVNEEQSGDRVSLDVRSPRRRRIVSFSHRSFRIEIWAPREADLDIRSGDGDVAVEKFGGRVTVLTRDGNIDARTMSGSLDLRTDEGSISGRNLDGRLKTHTGGGRIRVDGRFDALDLTSRNGSLDVEARDGSRVISPWGLDTADGHVVLRVADGLRADLDVHTGDGGITLELPVEVSRIVSRSSLRGSLNGGGPTLRVRSGDGAIRIERI